MPIPLRMVLTPFSAASAAAVAEAVDARLDQVAQDAALTLVERFVHFAQRVDARATYLFERGVVPAEHLVQARLVQAFGAERLSHHASRVAHFATLGARLVDEVRDRLGDDLLLARRRIETREHRVQGAARP